MSSLNATLHNFFNATMESVHTSLPGIIVAYDAETHRATIQPTIRLLRDNGVEIEIPELSDVPVIFPSSASFDIDFPLEKGDGVLLLFSESDTGFWRDSDGSISSPCTASKFGLDNAVAIPGLSPKPIRGRCKIHIDKDDVITFEAKKLVFDGPIVFHDNLIVRKDIFVGATDAKGVSVMDHLHPTPAGPSSPPTPMPNSTPEENYAI